MGREVFNFSPQEICTIYKWTDKSSFKLTLKLLEKLWKQSKDIQKIPKLIIAMKRNNEEIFILEGILKVEKK